MVQDCTDLIRSGPFFEGLYGDNLRSERTCMVQDSSPASEHTTVGKLPYHCELIYSMARRTLLRWLKIFLG